MILAFCDGEKSRVALLTWNLGRQLGNEISVFDNWADFIGQAGDQRVSLYLIDAGSVYRDNVLGLISRDYNVLFVSDPYRVEGISLLYYFRRGEGIEMLKKRVQEKLRSKR